MRAGKGRKGRATSPNRSPTPSTRDLAAAERRAILVVLASAKLEGAAVRELARVLTLASDRVEARMRSLAAQGLVQRHPQSRRRKVDGRWATLWVRTDALLDGAQASA